MRRPSGSRSRRRSPRTRPLGSKRTCGRSWTQVEGFSAWRRRTSRPSRRGSRWSRPTGSATTREPHSNPRASERYVLAVSVEILFETHAISVDNERGVATGWRDGQLSTHGRRLAAELGRRHLSLPPAAVYASDLGRAVETAEIAFG